VIALFAVLLAVPADARIVSKPGAVHIEKIPAEALAVESEGGLRAELLPSGDELLLEGAQGRAFVFYKREVRVYEVGKAFDETQPKPSCTPIADASCYAQWRAYLASASAPVQFTLEGLQLEAKAAQALLDAAGLKTLQVQLSPFGVHLKGARDEAETRRALRLIYPALLGPLRLD
jgi:hypothetical protein